MGLHFVDQGTTVLVGRGHNRVLPLPAAKAQQQRARHRPVRLGESYLAGYCVGRSEPYGSPTLEIS